MRRPSAWRLQVRISREADNALTLLCVRLRLERRQVIEGLLLGQLPAGAAFTAPDAYRVREAYWRKAGTVRVRVSISREADDALMRLCEQHRLEQRQVIERLLRGELTAGDAYAARERLSRDELLAMQRIGGPTT